MTAEPRVVIPFETERQKRMPTCDGCIKREQEKEALAQQTEAMATDIVGLERELKKYRRIVARLEGQIAKGLEENPDHKLAERLFNYWKNVTGRERSVFDTAREVAILRALKTLERAYGEDAPRALAAAFLGAARRGYVDAKGKRHDGIALVCRDAEHLEANIDRYREYERDNGREPRV